MRTLTPLVLVVLAVLPLHAAVDWNEARKGLTELDAMCHRDESELWGTSLCGPTLLVDPETRAFITNDPDRPNGTLPASVGIANTAFDWEGKRWTMVMLPLPADALSRKTLLAHESFHRVQDNLGFKKSGPENAHLDTMDGRYLLRLELRALIAAVRGGADAVRDAVLFRARRHQLFPNAAAEERALEMHEGLAEYTGTRLAAPSIADRPVGVIDKLRKAEERPTFVRSFAYDTIPAWGLLLERRDRKWTRALKPGDDVPALVREAYGIKIPADLAQAVGVRAARYDGDALLGEERARDEKRRKEIGVLRGRYVEGKVLVLPLREAKFEFDPNSVTPLEGRGNVYRTITVSDAWGRIVANGGALMSSDFKRVVVPAPASETDRAGDGWTLTLNEGWRIVKGEGEWMVKPASSE